MNIPLGPAGETTEQDDLYINSISSMASSYVDRGINQFQNLTENDRVQEVLKDMGLVSTVKSLNKERIKNILTAYALLKLMTSLKANFLKIGVIGLAGYMAYSNKDKLTSLYDSAVEMTDSNMA